MSQRRRLPLLIILFMFVSKQAIAAEGGFLQSFPALKDYIYQEPPSGFFLGFGVSPLGVVKNRFLIAGSFFQTHLLTTDWDFELLDISYALAKAQNSELLSNIFLFRTSPKYRITQMVSAGPLLGFEYVSFPNVNAKILRAPYETPNWEPFSSKGFVYGMMVTETIHSHPDSLIQINELIYQQTYSNKHTTQGWSYVFQDPTVQADASSLAPSLVVMIEMSFLF